MDSFKIYQLSTLFLVAICLPVFAQETKKDGIEIRVVESKENVVASELMGTWVPDKELSKRLGGRSDHVGDSRLVFRQNMDSQQRIIDFFKKTLAEFADRKKDEEAQAVIEALRKIYLTGEMEYGKKQFDFALVALYGTPRLLIYDREGDLESENVMLARDLKGDNDLLFLGGDFNNQSFGGFKREAAEK